MGNLSRAYLSVQGNGDLKKKTKFNIQLKVALKREKRSQVSRRKKLQKRRWQSGYIVSTKKVRITAPEVIGLVDSYHKSIVKFIRLLRRHSLKHRHKVWVNFTQTRLMESSGTLLLLAEIEQIQHIKGKLSIRGSLPNDKIAAQVFIKTGLSELLGIKHTMPIEHESVTYWKPFLSGDDTTATHVASQLTELNFKPILRNAMFRGISEATTNTCMHAYHDKTHRCDGFLYGQKKWWMFTGYDDKNLTLVVCDLGQGIPKTLKFREDYSAISKLLKKIVGDKDSKSIKAAMEIGKTSSGLAHRGKGMVQLKQAIDEMGAGTLSILSNRGRYIYTANGSENYKRDFKCSIMGTIISWSAPIDNLQQMMNNEQKHD